MKPAYQDERCLQSQIFWSKSFNMMALAGTVNRRWYARLIMADYSSTVSERCRSKLKPEPGLRTLDTAFLILFKI